MTIPFFSVLIPTHNRAPLLLRAIDSVLKQSYPQYEILVVDDGSTDQTAEMLRDHLKQIRRRDRVRYFAQIQQGKSIALNRGLSEVRGDWIAFLDSDDFWLPDKLESQVQAIQYYGDECGACITDARYINNADLNMTAFERAGLSCDALVGSIRDPANFVLNHSRGLYMQTIVVRKDVMCRVGEFDPALRVTQDTDFIYRVAVNSNLCYVNKPLVHIDRSVGTRNGLMELFQRDGWLSLQERQHVYEKWLKLSQGCKSPVQRIIKGKLQSVYSGWASWYLLNEDYARARQASAMALRTRFTPRVAAKWALTRLIPRILHYLLSRKKSAASNPTMNFEALKSPR